MKKILFALLAITAATSIHATCPNDPYAGMYNDSVYNKPVQPMDRPAMQPMMEPMQRDTMNIDVKETAVKGDVTDRANVVNPMESTDRLDVTNPALKSPMTERANVTTPATTTDRSVDSIDARVEAMDSENYDDTAASDDEATL